MKLSDPRFPMTISDQAVNAVTENPFKYPRPDNVKGKVESTNGTGIKPNVTFVGAMTYLYNECMKHMLRKFRQDMVETFDKLNKHNNGDYNLSDFECGTSAIKKGIYLYPWDIRCMLIPLNPKLKVQDLDIMSQEMKELDKYFYLEIVSANLKYRVPSQPLQVKGRALDSQRTKP